MSERQHGQRQVGGEKKVGMGGNEAHPLSLESWKVALPRNSLVGCLLARRRVQSTQGETEVLRRRRKVTDRPAQAVFP
jgi:hypothetical protein